MSEFYNEIEFGVAQPLIKEFGFAAWVIRAGVPTGPAHNPQPGAPTRHACMIVETGYSLTNRTETLVLVGDKLGLISTDLDVVPTKDDDIEIAGIVYHFLDVKIIAPGGQTVLYKYHARR
jgi:hypothetical protein